MRVNVKKIHSVSQSVLVRKRSTWNYTVDLSFYLDSWGVVVTVRGNLMLQSQCLPNPIIVSFGVPRSPVLPPPVLPLLFHTSPFLLSYFSNPLDPASSSSVPESFVLFCCFFFSCSTFVLLFCFLLVSTHFVTFPPFLSASLFHSLCCMAT